MKYNKASLLKVITDFLMPVFEKEGYALKNKQYFEKDVSKDTIYQYQILLTYRGQFYLSLRLNLLDKHISKRVNEILLDIMDDERFFILTILTERQFLI